MKIKKCLQLFGLIFLGVVSISTYGASSSSTFSLELFNSNFNTSSFTCRELEKGNLNIKYPFQVFDNNRRWGLTFYVGGDAPGNYYKKILCEDSSAKASCQLDISMTVDQELHFHGVDITTPHCDGMKLEWGGNPDNYRIITFTK